jgi:hypothetical protein
LIVYDIDENYNYERFKIGDGSSNVNDLPFISERFYKQDDEPTDAPDGSLWVDMDAESSSSGGSGKTPVRGVDYWTEEDKAEIKAYVDEAILGGAW